MILLDPLARPVIAHRGASGAFPENTLLAFSEGLAAGADGLELDVRLSVDRVPVVLHDPTLDRTTDASGPVAARTRDELGRVDAGRGEVVPTLEEVLDAFPGIPIIVEIKAAAASGPVRTLIKRLGAEDRVLIGSFSTRALVPFLRSPIATAASRPETGLVWAASRIGASGPRIGQAFSVPERSGSLHLVDARFVRAVRRSGRPVHVWTVDAPEDAHRLWTLGVSGIITNWPDRIVEARAEDPGPRTGRS